MIGFSVEVQPDNAAATSESELITKFGSQSNGDKAAAQDRLGPKGLVIFLALLSAFVPLSTDLYLPALPTMTKYFQVPEYT